VHLGKPLRFYRGFNNLRHSPVSREGLGVAVFMGGLGAAWFFSLFDWGFTNAVSYLFGVLGSLAGIAGLYYMTCCYRIPARPFWNHWQVNTTFYGTALSLGAIAMAVLTVPALAMADQGYAGLLISLLLMVALGSLTEGVGFAIHARDMRQASHEGAASQYIQDTTFGKTYWVRNLLQAANSLTALGLYLLLDNGVISLADNTALLCLIAGLFLSVLTTSVISRALFYVLVVPTTMPGAFFWKNKAFEQHARDIGLAAMPQVGVAVHGH